MAIDNPVLVKDLRTRMRGLRAPILLFVYLGVLSLVMFITYTAWAGSAFPQQGGAPGSAISRNFYVALFIAQGCVVLLFAPAFTAGAMTLEHEQKTFEMLIITRLTPGSIIGGRLFSAVSFAQLMLFTSVPLVSVTYLLGGVSPAEVLFSYLSLALFCFVAGSLGILSSVLVTSTAASTVISFGLMGLYLGATGVAAIQGAVTTAMGRAVTQPLAALNPFGAIYSATNGAAFFGLSPPVWLTSGLVSLVLASLLGVAAVERLGEYYGRVARWPARTLLTAFVLLVGLLSMGWTWATIWGPPAAKPDAMVRAHTAVLLGVVTFFGMVFAPIVCSTDGLSWRLDRGRLWRALNPANAFRGQPVAGLVFLLLWVALAVPVAMLGCELGGTPLAQGGALRLTAMFLVPALSVTAAGLLAMVLSALIGRRGAALGVTYVVIFLVAFLPVLGLIWAEATGPRTAAGYEYPLITSALYLNPIAALIDAADPGVFVARGRVGMLALSPGVPAYVVHLVLMGGFGVALALLLIPLALRRPSRTVLRPPAPIG